MQSLQAWLMSPASGRSKCCGIQKAFDSFPFRIDVGGHHRMAGNAPISSSTACRARKFTDEDLVRILGSEEAVEIALRDQEPDKGLELDFRGFPQRPRFDRPSPQRGERFAQYHRETNALPGQSWLKSKPVRKEPKTPKKPIHDDPVPWQSPKQQPPPPVLTFPENRAPFVERKVYQWERKGYIPYFEKLYPDPVVEVEVTVTNDPVICDEWALARKTEGIVIFGFDTKFWTYEQKGLYYSDSHPGEWSDIALIQLACEKHILLVQPLDMPVEKLGPAFRSIMSYKSIKKATYNAMPKTRAVKMCDVHLHGVHDHFNVLKQTLDLSTKRMLPMNIEYLDVQGMAMHLLGINLEAELSSSAHWERDTLDDEMVEVAAREAWCSWALYGILTRMTRELTILWSKGFPKFKGRVAYAKKKELRRAILLSKSTTLEYVREDQMEKLSRKSLPKLSKAAAAELVLDAGIDLYEAVDKDVLFEANQVVFTDETSGREDGDDQLDDESDRGYKVWDEEGISTETWEQYLEEPAEDEEQVERLGGPLLGSSEPLEMGRANVSDEGFDDTEIEEDQRFPVSSEGDDGGYWVVRDNIGDLDSNDGGMADTGRGSHVAEKSRSQRVLVEDLSAVDDFDQVGTTEEMLELLSESSEGEDGDESEVDDDDGDDEDLVESGVKVEVDSRVKSNPGGSRHQSRGRINAESTWSGGDTGVVSKTKKETDTFGGREADSGLSSDWISNVDDRDKRASDLVDDLEGMEFEDDEISSILENW